MSTITLWLSSSRFVAAIARLSLGPLLPLLPDIKESKPALLSAYSTGYLLTQVMGGKLADTYGARIIVAASNWWSAVWLGCLVFSNTSWTRVYFGLGLAAGPLFPAGSAAIALSPNKATSAAWIDAAAATGTMVASLAPVVTVALNGNWKLFLLIVVVLELITGAGAYIYINDPIREHEDVYTPKKKKMSWPISILFSPSALCAYLCHSTENLTKYSLNAWAVTSFIERYNISVTTAGSVLAMQEGIGVVSRLIFASRYSSFRDRGAVSFGAFSIQALAVGLVFFAPSMKWASVGMIVQSLAAGSHSIGFRLSYLELSEYHAGSISGLGNTIASVASAAGPLAIGVLIEHRGRWINVGWFMFTINLIGALCALTLSREMRSRSRAVKTVETF